MRRILVVANQTLGGEALRKEIRTRINDGPCSFHVVVPQTVPSDLAVGWLPEDPAVGADLRARVREQAFEEAEQRAQGRLTLLLNDIRDEGAKADGELGDPDPDRAIDAVLGKGFDEVLLSTLPTRLSRWLRMDLPSRLERRLDIPVTTVIAP